MRIVLLFLLVCSASYATAQTAYKLSYKVVEYHSEPYISQLWVTPSWLRLDQKNDDSGYILYDRNQKIIYNVFHDDRRLLTINPLPVEHKTPEAIKVHIDKDIDENAPKMLGKSPVSYQVTVDGAECMKFVTVEGVAKNAVSAWQEFNTRLSDQQTANIPATPKELRDNCNFLEHVYDPSIVLSRGLPILWSTKARDMQLVDITEEADIPEGFFSLPQDYQAGSMPLNGLLQE